MKRSTVMTQSLIDQNPRRTDKRYFIIDMQVKSAVLPDSYAERLRDEPRFTLLQKQLMAMFVIAASAFLLAYEFGWIDIAADFFAGR